MEEKCPICGSMEVISGELSSTGGFVFIPDSEKGKLVMKSSFVKAQACKKCGEIFSLKLADKPNKITN